MKMLDRWGWKTSVGGLKLLYDGKFTGYRVILDGEWPKTFRVQCPGGGLSDMVNLIRAKDTARHLADRKLHPR